MVEELILKHSGEENYISLKSLFYKYNKRMDLIDSKQKQLIIDVINGNLVNSEIVNDTAALSALLAFYLYDNFLDNYDALVRNFGSNHTIASLKLTSKKTISDLKEKTKLSSFSVSYDENSKMGTDFFIVDYNDFERSENDYKFGTLRIGGLSITEGDDSSWKLKNLDILEITSLKPLQYMKLEPSWSLNLSLKKERELSNSYDTELSVGFGASYRMSNFMIFALPSYDFFGKGFIKSGFQYKFNNIGFKAESIDLDKTKLLISQRLGSSFSLNLSYLIEKNQDNTSSASIKYFF
jgi:hypothetical protein